MALSKDVQERFQKVDDRISKLVATVAALSAVVAGLTAWQVTVQDSVSNLEGKVSALENPVVVVPPKEEPAPPKEEPKPPPKEEQTPPPPAENAACTMTTSNLATALTSIATGKVICLADGTYGSISLAANGGGGTLTAAHPGKVTVGSIKATGSGYVVQGLISGSATCDSSGSNITYDQMRINGEASAYGGSGPCTWSRSEIFAPASSGEHDATRAWQGATVSFIEDKIHIADENGGHNDGFQSYAGVSGVRAVGNEYVGGLGSQGFFIKDCLSAGCFNVEFSDNRLVDRPASSSGQGSPLQLFEVKPKSGAPFYTGYGARIEHNEILRNPNIVVLRGCRSEKLLVAHNLTDGIAYLQDESCNISSWKAAQVTEFDNSTTGKATSATQGITWDPATRHYGPQA